MPAASPACECRRGYAPRSGLPVSGHTDSPYHVSPRMTWIGSTDSRRLNQRSVHYWMCSQWYSDLHGDLTVTTYYTLWRLNTHSNDIVNNGKTNNNNNNTTVNHIHNNHDTNTYIAPTLSHFGNPSSRYIRKKIRRYCPTMNTKVVNRWINTLGS